MSGDGEPKIPNDERAETLPVETPAGVELGQPADAPYLLVYEESSSWVYPLPRRGQVIVGRAEDADLRLPHAAVSRHHARLGVRAGEVRVTDLKSQNGTDVNGERLTGSRVLVSGDTVGISGTLLVFHAGSLRQPARTFVPLSEFRARAEEELDRSRRSHRSWAIASLQLGIAAAQRPRVADALAGLVRRIDVLTWDGTDRVLVLLAETGPEQATGAISRLLDAVSAIAPSAKAGLASWPGDGFDVDTLLASARNAAAASAASHLTQAADNYQTIQIENVEVIASTPSMVRLFGLLRRLAVAEMPVLIRGETGSGKEIAARALHAWSARRERPFVALNCAAIPEHLVESELFGYERGAFSGAVGNKEGLLEAAAGGTLFLDEVGELPQPAQAKLLRALETKRLRPLGNVRERALDLRVVAATLRNLEDDVEAGRFRRDLFFRLKGASVWIPPLRDRRSEIPILARIFVARACARLGRPVLTISPAVIEGLTVHPWKGNVRELQNLMEYIAAVAKGPVLELWHLAQWIGGTVTDDDGEVTIEDRAATDFRPIGEEIRELERSRMIAALMETGGNRTQAARLIGMPLRTFVAKLKAYDLQDLVVLGASGR